MSALRQETVVPQLTAREQLEINSIIMLAQAASTPEETERVMIRAIMASRSFVVRTALVYLAPSAVINAGRLIAMTDMAWMAFEPYWVRMVRPLFMAQVYALKARDIKGHIPDRVVEKMADDYARRLGTYYNRTSAAAMVEGFNTHVNRKVAAKMAGERVIQAWGTTKRQALAIINAEIDKPLSSSQKLDPRQHIRQFILRQVRERARTIAKQETFVMSQEGQQVNWLYQQKVGLLPQSTERVWVTARDEMVCSACGPMHLKTVALDAPFVLDDGTKLWVPGVHVECRCRMRLKINTVDAFGKADRWDLEDERDHPRDRRGRWAVKDERDDIMRNEVQAVLNRGPSPDRVTAVSRVQATEKIKATPKIGASRKIEAPTKIGAESSQKITGATASLRSVAPADVQRVQAKLADLNGKISASVLQAISAAPLAENQLKYRNTIKLDKPVYATLDDFQLEHDTDLDVTGAQLTSETEWGDEKYAVQDVSDYAQEMIEMEVSDIIETNRNNLSENFDGQIGYAELHSNVVWETVTDAAGGFPEPDEYREIPFYNRDGLVGIKRFSVSELAGRMQVEPNDFVQRVYRVSEIHADHDSWTNDANSKYGYEAWYLNGSYDAEMIHRDRSEFGAVVEIWQLWPRLDEPDTD